ncbi:C-type lectin domain family 14 member A [Phodopus roborovskii]|uniref:C-type lectin domain family 14 member A n=1 Tax=Phodopus roborovskii TaxID=109678 RepID=A0AAU9ZSK0_PHORO|nr:C-type lectin domain family 14 member A [Phodopus roborovskii]CAH6838716.1 Clec14a [Phodopus roborovskii]
MRPALALCLLCPAFWPRPGSGEHPTADRAACSASGACYSLHHATIKRRAAEEACSLRGGTLSTVHSGSELHAVLALLRAGPGPGGGSKDLLFWVALERGRSHCTLEREPLRGFSWLSPEGGGSEDNTLPWVEEPQLSCTVRKCAGLQVTGEVEPAGWKEMRCHLRANGYLCKYQFEALCPAPRPGSASNLSFRAPFRLSSSALDFSPPGTEVSVICPGGDLSVYATCIQEDTSARWDGLFPGALLCPCSGRYLRAGKCVELPDCLDHLGGFACECVPGFELGKDRRSCKAQGEGQPTLAGTKLPPRHVSATPASPATNRTWLGRAHEKLGEMPQVTGQDSFATSIPEILQWGMQSTLPTAQRSPQPKPKVTARPSGSLIPTLNYTSSPSASPNFDSSSTVVFILVSIAVIVLVILTMTVLGLFKLCFHKSPSSRKRNSALDSRGVESNAEVTALSPNSAHCTDNGVKVGDCGLRGRAEGASLAGSSLGSGDT